MSNSSGGSAPQTLAQQVATFVSAADAASQIGSIVAQFAGGLNFVSTYVPPKTVSSVRQESIIASLTDAMSKAKPYVSKAYQQQFSGQPEGVDSGVIWNYTSNSGSQPNFGPTAQVIATNFDNWGIPATDGNIDDMINTMLSELNSTLGQVGSSTGTYSLNANQSVQWAICYGTFAQDDQDNLCIIWGFAAAEVGGF